MVLSGLAMGTVFDVYRVACHRFSVRRWMLPGLDLLYWAAATLGVFRVLLQHNNGEIRLYVFLGLGIGITGYFGLFSPWVVRISSWSFRAAAWTFSALLKTARLLLIVPLGWMLKAIAKLLDVVFLVFAALLLWIGRLALRPLRPLGVRLWRLLLPVRRRLAPMAEAARRIGSALRRIRDLFRGKD
jgi:spore cortex biosynthesis protein YabQ